jgi:hypothetical protein
VGDVSIVHLVTVSYATGAAMTPGFAVAARNSAKQLVYQQYSPTFQVPLSVKSLGGLGAPAVSLLGSLVDILQFYAE